MAQDHGNKKYYQVLIDPHRSQLIEQLALKGGIKDTAWIRQAAYEKLQQEYNSSDYKVAEAKDKVLWRESVRNRILGRSKRKVSHCESNKKQEFKNAH